MIVKDVKFSDDFIQFQFEKNTHKVELNTVSKIFVETNDTDPLHEVLVVLVAPDMDIKIPVSEESLMNMLPRLLDFAGFDDQLFIQAMSSTENKQFICWQK